MNRFFSLLLTVALFNINNCPGQTTSAIDPYVSFIQTQNQSAKEYILDLFNDHDIVVICERHHGEMTQYDLLTDIISDKAFVKKVGNVFTEVGLSTLNPALNTFLHTKGLSSDSVTKCIIDFQRNCSFWPIWSNKNYSFFLHTVYAVNNSLPAKDAINVYPSDLPFAWKEADSLSMLKLRAMLLERDSIMASQIITKYNEIKSSGQKRKKALVVMNYRHAFNQEFFRDGHLQKNTAGFLYRQYGNRVANVLLNTPVIRNDGKAALLQEGKWDAAFKLLNKENTGFNFKNSPFGKDSFDLWPHKTNYTYQQVFTGFAFYQPIEKHHTIQGCSGLIDPAFRNEVLNRIDLICIVGGEYKKIANFKTPLANNYAFVNTEEDRKYSRVDTLTNTRDRWLK